MKSLLFGKDPDAGRVRARGEGDDRMRWLDGTIDLMDVSLGDNEGQRSLACCSPWGRKESDTTERLNDHSPSHPLSS